MIYQHQFNVTTAGRHLINVTDDIAEYIEKSRAKTGLCHIFLHHTSASLVICENADPLVQKDLEAFMRRLVPDGDPLFRHVAEGNDDMPSHIRTILTQSFITIPVTEGRLNLGIWQGIYVWEHRIRAHNRQLTITIIS